jgi:hypothetical protein
MNGERWTRSIQLPSGEAETGVAQLWARAKIDTLSDEMIRGGDAWGLQQDITALALKHHLVTDYTSLVVVDHEITRPYGAPLESQEIPQTLPQGQTLRAAADVDVAAQANQIVTAEIPAAMPSPVMPNDVMTEAVITAATVDTPETSGDARAAQQTTEPLVAVPQPQLEGSVVVPIQPTTSTVNGVVDTTSLAAAPITVERVPVPTGSRLFINVAIMVSVVLLLGLLWLAKLKRN